MIEDFGTAPGGETVKRVTIRGGGLTAKLITWGGAVQDLRLVGHDAPLVLGFEDFAHYPEYSPSFGITAGRYANRIRDGRFVIDGERYQTDTNFLGKHTLHGGRIGTGRRVWTLGETTEDSVTMHITCENGEMGFPGNLAIDCTYRVLAAGRLVVELSASTDAPTLCNLAHHSYFNLDDGGRSDILGHRMRIGAHAYLPVDNELIPTGRVEPVEGTDFDFRFSRTIRGDPDKPYPCYDHNFCLSSSRGPLRNAAWVQGEGSGLEMEVWTTEPGVQFYDAVNVSPPVDGLEGIRYGKHAGLCLEPQVWPDAPNRPYFPSALLRPGETYRQVTEYRFRLDMNG